MAGNSLKQKALSIFEQVKYYWNDPPKGRFIPFREIASYAGGGIGAYLIINIATACLLSTNNTLISSSLGVDPTHMYILYVIAVLANIPLTAIRANIIDNTRSKAGKYRPYILNMGLPTAVVSILMVWFPYDKLEVVFGSGMLFGETRGYIAKCALILIFNLFLHFFYYFFYDAYENLIHVMSPNTQERADVTSIKSVVYSFGPTIVQLIVPLIAANVFHSNTTDIRVYRLVYPILSILGILLCIIVYKNTEERIVQARTHVVQIKFIDALKEVAKNKYFWIISLASWIGFLEASYSNILNWVYNYGGVCSGNVFALVTTLYGNASLWGMILAPFCIRKWGKKAVLVVTNILNIIFILMLLPSIKANPSAVIWLVLGCMYLNAFMGSFAHILNPAIQADIRDYQQYKTGERIDGMFSAVATIGTVIGFITSSVLPFIYERGGITKDNAAAVTSNPEILNRMMGDGKTVGTILSEQLANGQDNFNNAYSALYDPEVLYPLLSALILISAFGALLNVVPYFWYDFTEKKQKGVIKVLQVRAMFEDYGNHALDDHRLVEAIDMVREAREMAASEAKPVSKEMYKSVSDKEEYKAAKKAYKEALLFNENIDISKFVCAELDKFDTPAVQHQVFVNTSIYEQGLEGIKNASMDELKENLAKAKALPANTQDEKELRKFSVEIAKKQIASKKAYNKYFGNIKEFVEPDMDALLKLFDEEDDYNSKIAELVKEKEIARKAKEPSIIANCNAQIKELEIKRKAVRKSSKVLAYEFAEFNRAAKAYTDARKLLTQQENFKHFDEIAALYDEAKANAEEKDRIKAEKIAAKRAEEEAELEAKKAAKAQKKANKKDK
ncbi:isoprimeverose transporter [Clostridiales bacterium]|nr:isoprimeverose transporter [Clostridiales bacterium]